MSRLRVWSMAFAGLAMVAVTGCVMPRSDITLHPTSAMVRIGGVDGAPVPPAASSYHLDMVRNEREGFQVAVMPPTGQRGKAYAGAAVFAGAWTDGPNELDVRLYRVLPVNHEPPPTTGQFVVPPRHLGQIPDVLVPRRGGFSTAFPLVNPGGTPLTWYVEFHTTPKTRPGRYRYLVWVGCKVHSDLHIVVDVHEPVLPDRLPFRTATMWNWSLEEYYGRPLTFEEKQVFWNFFLDQRIGPNDFFGKAANPSPEDVQRAGLKDRGLSVMNLTFVGGKRPKPLSEDYKAKMGPQLKAWREQLKAQGMDNDAVILLADEPEAGTAEVCRANARWFKEQFPEVKIWVATRPAPEWDFADIFDPVMAHSTDFYKPHSHTDEAFRWWKSQSSKEYWWFHSVEPYAPYTNIRLDNLPIEARVAGWQSALYGVDGYEYFWMTDWANNKDTREMAWPDRAAVWKTGMSGAGTLCYPDEKMRPMPSLRLVNLRDGLEDWALIEMLAARNDSAARRKAVGDVTTDLARYTTDPQVVLKARRKVIEQLR